PYEGPTMMAVLLKHREGPIPSLTAARDDIPADLDTVFRCMVAKAPADRIQTMTEVGQVLEGLRGYLLEQGAMPGTGMVLELDRGTTGVWETPTSVGLAPPEAPAARPQATVRGLTLKILLVEPSRTQSGIIRKYLEANGAQDIVA